MEKDIYNSEWCKEKHDKSDKEIVIVHKRIDKVDTKVDKLGTVLWSIVLLLIANLGGIIGVLLTIKSKTIL